MATSRKWLCIGSLAAAGLLSIRLSRLGVLGLLWSGFPLKDHSATLLLFFFPCVLAFPFFALTVGVSRLASLGLWMMGPINLFSVFQITKPHAQESFLANITIALVCLFTSPSILLLIVASLTQFSAHFYEFTHDSGWVRWKKEKHEIPV